MAELGMQVDAWGAFIPGRADLVDKLKEKVVKAMESRGLDNLTVTEAGMQVSGSSVPVGERRDHILFDQKLGWASTATVALRVAPRGTEDMEISWRLMERNWGTWLLQRFGQGTLIFLGFIIAGAGLLTSIFGYGLCVIPIGVAIMGVGFGWWGVSKRRTQASAYQQFDSRVLAQTVDFCLMSALEELGVAGDELRVLQKAQMEGIGRLGTN